MATYAHASHFNHLEQQISELKQEKAEIKCELRHLQAVNTDLNCQLREMNCQLREMQDRHRGEITKLYERERIHEASCNCYNSKVCFLMLTSNFK